MKISFNPSNSNKNILDLIKNNKDIIFDLKGHSIFARGVEFKGTDTNTWRDIKINNVSIGSHTLDLRNGSNTTLTNTNGVVTINSTWRPVVDNLTSDSTTSSLSAKQGKVLKALIDGKSNSDHNHDGRYVKKSGDTMQGVLTIDTTNFGALTIKRNDDANGASIQFRGKSSVYGYIGLNNSTKDKQFLRWGSDTSRVYTILDTSSTYISNGKGIINGTTITQVDNATNSTNSTNARKLVNWYSARPTSLNAQFGDGSLRIFYATSSTTEGKPAEDSHILHLAWDNTGGYDAQLAVHARSGKVSTRAQNGGTWQSWKTLAFITDIPTSLKNPYSFNVFGVVYDGSAAKTVTTSTFISQVTEGTSTITDGTMLITSYASNSGFADTNAANVPYKRKAIHLWEYIKTKTDSLYATKNHNHDYLVVNSADDKSFNSAYHNFQVLYAGGGNGITGKPANVDAFGLFKFRAASGWSGQMLLANGGSLYIRSSEDAKMTNTLAWKTILDSSNYSGILDYRYYTESEVNSLLSRKLDRVNLTTGSWNPRGWNLAADYHYNGGDLSISENNGKMYVSVDGCFWQNEGQYRVLDTSDIGDIRDSVTLHQYLSATDAAWYPLVWGEASHNNTSDSTGPIYKSYDKLCWQTSSQTLYATNIQTNNIKNLSIGGGIYWNPYVETASDGSDAASITLVRQGVAGGTTLVLSQQNDINDTIQFKTNTAARLYHNSYPILTTQNTYVNNNKGYINGTEITQVNNSDTLDGAHLSDIKNWSDRTASVQWKAGWYKVASAKTAPDTEAFLTLDVNAAQSNGHATLFIRKRADNKPYFICTYNNNLNLADFRLYYNGMSMVLYARVPNDWNGRVFRIISEGREGTYDHIWTLYSNVSSTDPNAISAEGGNPYINPTYSGIVDWSNSSDKANYANSAGSVAWNNVTGKPSAFNPAAHTHTVFKNNLMIKGTNGISDSAYIHLGIGDSDTGFKWISDGVCQIYANYAAVGQWTSGGMNWFKNPTVNGNKVWNAGNDGSGSGLDADTVDGYHATDGRTFNGYIHWGSWNEIWSDGTHTHPWYGFDHRYPNTGTNSTTISDYFGMTIKTYNTLLLDCGTLLLNSRNNVGIGTTSPTQKLDVHGNIRATGQIIREGSSQIWVYGRNAALLRETSVAGYHTLWSLKTTNGSWDFGEYNINSDWNNIPVLSYVTDSDYNSGNNATTYQIKFPLASGTVALTSNIPNPTNYYWANVKISASSSTTTSPTFSNVYLGNSLYLNNRGSNSIYNGPKDSANGVGGPLNNLVFSSWYGVSFTTSCAGFTYTNKNAVSINCRTGQLYAREVQANGFMHTGHNNNDAVLLAGGGYKTLKDFIFLNKSYKYTDNEHYSLAFHKLSGICNNLVWVDGHVKGSVAKFFVIDPAVFPYRYNEDPNLNTIYCMSGNNYITINAIGIVTINNATDHEQRVGFFYTGRA